MTHARIPDFSMPLPSPRVVSDRLVPVVDPVLVAIDAHAEAWAVFQVAPKGPATARAETALHAAIDELLTTPCGSRFGALALIRHLRWLIREEAITAGPDDFTGSLVLMREAELSRFVGSDLSPEILPAAAPLGRLAPQARRRQPPALDAVSRLPGTRGVARALGCAVEALSALIIVGGGVALTAVASLH